MSHQWSRRTFGLKAVTVAASYVVLPRVGFADDGAEAFRDLVIAVGRRHFPNMTFVAAGRTIVSGDHTLYLDNIRHIVLATPPDRRESAIVHWLKTFTPEADRATEAAKERIKDWAAAKPLLRARLTSRAMIEQIPDLPHDLFQNDLAIFYTIDLGDKDLYVRTDTSASWHVTQAQIHDAAIANLEAMSAAMPLQVRSYGHAKGHYLFVQGGDGYDASRILLPRFRKRLQSLLGPLVFVGVPAKDLMICWSGDFSLPEGMVSLVEENASRLPHPISAKIFALTDLGVSRVYLAENDADARRQAAQDGAR